MVAVVVPFLLALVTRDVAVATVVGLAFAMAAATFCPLLVLGIWWRGLTDMGALAGLLVGGALTGGAVLDNLLVDRTGGWFAALVDQPAAWAVPAVLRDDGGRLPAHRGTGCRPTRRASWSVCTPRRRSSSTAAEPLVVRAIVDRWPTARVRPPSRPHPRAVAAPRAALPR